MRIISNSGNARVIDVVAEANADTGLDIVTDRVSLFGATALFDMSTAVGFQASVAE